MNYCRDGRRTTGRNLRTKSSEDKPWETPKPKEISFEDFTGEVEIVKANRIYLPLSRLSAKAVSHIKRLAAFHNPKYYELLNARKPLYNTLSIICRADMTDKYISVPRGCEQPLIELFQSNFTSWSTIDKTNPGRPIDASFNGQLREEQEAAKQRTKFFVIDNITFICNDSEKGSTAGSFMMKLIRLKKKYGLTTIVIAHTPKRRGWEPITQNDLAGSAKLINFFDAGIALARSAKDNNLRYLKQVKVHTGEYRYDAENVIVYDVAKNGGFLTFELQGYAKEDDHLKNREGSDDYDEIIEILKLQRDGKTVRDIAEALDMSKSTVQRRLDKAKACNITILEQCRCPHQGV